MSNYAHDYMVTPLFEREADAEPGPFYVIKGQCITCNLPCETAPRNIKFNLQSADTDALYCRVVKQPETDEELDNMIEALEGSCIQSLRYCGTNKVILERLTLAGCASRCDAIASSGKKPEEVKPWWKLW